MKYTKTVGRIMLEIAERKDLGQDLNTGSDRYVSMLEADGFESNEARGMVADLIRFAEQ